MLTAKAPPLVLMEKLIRKKLDGDVTLLYSADGAKGMYVVLALQSTKNLKG